jgi:hypothetical protein
MTIRITGGGAAGKHRTGWSLAASGWDESALFTRRMTIQAAQDQARRG